MWHSSLHDWFSGSSLSSQSCLPSQSRGGAYTILTHQFRQNFSDPFAKSCLKSPGNVECLINLSLKRFHLTLTVAAWHSGAQSKPRHWRAQTDGLYTSYRFSQGPDWRQRNSFSHIRKQPWSRTEGVSWLWQLFEIEHSTWAVAFSYYFLDGDTHTDQGPFF